MKLITLWMMLLAFSANAKMIEFDLDVQYTENGKTKESISQVTSKLGESFVFENNNILTEVSPTDFKSSTIDIESKDLIMLTTRVFQLNNGKKTLIGKPKVITALGVPATISIEQDDGMKLVMKVLAKDKSEKL